MAEEGGKESLQAAVIIAFTAILSGNQRQRKAAEDDLRALEVTEGAFTGTYPAEAWPTCLVLVQTLDWC